MIDAATAKPGRPDQPPLSDKHFVSYRSMKPPFPEGIEVIYLGMGCFWGAERIFWNLHGVYVTAVGYAGGFTENASYEDVCTGRTGHAEVVLVAYDPEVVSLGRILKSFWEEHDPTQRDRQGNDVGTQYRSAIYWTNEAQRDVAVESMGTYGTALGDAGYGEITTEIAEAGPFYYAEEYHQQYLAKNPNGYCNHGFCQIAYSE
ncbi:MAG: peptide-methionine (S)-S-oxide reductase MsrA [Actinomycetota bacterium]